MHQPPPTSPPVTRLVALSELIEHPGNPREHFTDIEELAASMLEVGLVEPIVVERHESGYRLIAGARRVKAARLARIRVLPAIVRPPERNPVKAVALMLIENGQRRNLDPIEEARGYARMQGLDPSLSHARIAEMVGRSQPYVSGRLALLNLSHAEQQQIRAGELRLAEAIDTARNRAGTHRATHFTGWHLGKTHRLAGPANARCVQQQHLAGRRVGGACGECWEHAIRADEREQVLAEQQLVDPASGAGVVRQTATCSGCVERHAATGEASA